PSARPTHEPSAHEPVAHEAVAHEPVAHATPPHGPIAFETSTRAAWTHEASAQGPELPGSAAQADPDAAARAPADGLADDPADLPARAHDRAAEPTPDAHAAPPEATGDAASAPVRPEPASAATGLAAPLEQRRRGGVSPWIVIAILVAVTAALLLGLSQLHF
ncbi:hypothetical protein L6R52_43560, partial [Myxococcota bacterium]|nr:hypothetical protein [Myxococcota bacterium]